MESRAGSPFGRRTSWPTAYTFDRVDIEQYLGHGYVPTISEDPLSLLGAWSRKPIRRADTVAFDELVPEGVAAFRAAILDSVDRGSAHSRQVVLLSGGLDSRMILAGLLEVFDRSEILAATFGRPGEEDFDVATIVAREAGVEHERLDSFSVDWTTPGLVDSVLARELPLAAPFGQRYLSYLLHEHLGRDNVFWDGLCGEVLGGKAAISDPNTREWDSAIQQLIEIQMLPGTPSLVPTGFDARRNLPDGPALPAEVMRYWDQLTLDVRHRCKHSTRRLRGYKIQLPFLAGPWLDFMLTVPEEYRRRQTLYREIQAAAFPQLFALPTTSPGGGTFNDTPAWSRLRPLRRRARRTARTWGLLSPAPDAATRHTNFAIRTSVLSPGPMRDLAQENIVDLSRRGVIDWTDVLALAPEQSTTPDHRVIARLVDLELNLKASEMVGDGGLEPPTSSV